MLPWVVIEEAMAKQPESFVPFTAGSQGALAELLSGCCCALTCSLVTCVPGCIAVWLFAVGSAQRYSIG